MGKPLRITHFLPSIRLEAGGVVRAVLDWCTVFAARGHHVTLLTSDRTDCPAHWTDLAGATPRVVTLPAPARFGRLTKPAMSIAGEAIQSSDVLHLHAPWLPANPQLAGVARLAGVPYLLTVHGMLDDWSMAQRAIKKKIYLKFFARKLLDDAAAVHCTAAAELRQAGKWFSNPRRLVLPYLVDLEPFCTLPPVDLAREAFPQLLRDEPCVLFLSRLHPKKGVEHLIRAAGILRDQNVTCRTLIAGTGDEAYVETLKKLIVDLKLTDRVDLLGLVKGDLKLSLYQAADLFVLPTEQENFGLVLIESLACGTPVVTTRGVDIWEELQQAGAMIVEPAPAPLAESIVTLLQSPTPSAHTGAGGRKWVFIHLDPAELTSKYEAAYRGEFRAKGKDEP